MIKAVVIFVLMLFFIPKADAYKVFYYDADGNRIYKTIEQKDFAKYKNRPRRSYVRIPRTNWEITDSMRARKHTTSQTTHRNRITNK